MTRFDRAHAQKSPAHAATPLPRKPDETPTSTLIAHRGLTPERLLQLQRTVGNAAVQRALAMETAGAASSIQRDEASEQPSGGYGAALFGETEGEKDDTGESPGAVWRWLTWAGIGLADLIAGVVSWFGLESYDISADLLRHYMSGRGADYELSMPDEWAAKIASEYKKTGTRRNVSSYEWGIPDMKNALGHFDLKVENIAGDSKLYTVTDKYWFPYKPHDKYEQGRHGFEVDFFGALPAPARANVNAALAALGTWRNPGGFDERSR